MTGRPFAVLLLALFTAAAVQADDPKLPDVKAYDTIIVDTLRDVHNKGADLYNEHKDFMGAYRIYQGALLTVRPLLAHRPAAQKLIDEGMASAEKEPSFAIRAYKLHETIEAVRALLKTGGVTPAKKEEKKPSGEKKPANPPDSTKPAEKNPTVPYELAPQPRQKKPVG